MFLQVAAPPGGATSWSLGWASEPAPAPRPGRAAVNAYAPEPAATSASTTRAAASAPAPAAAAPAAAGAAAYPEVKENTAASAPKGGVSSNVFANGSNQNCGKLKIQCEKTWGGREGSYGTPWERLVLGTQRSAMLDAIAYCSVHSGVRYAVNGHQCFV
jgi:hypothetical protein